MKETKATDMGKLTNWEAKGSFRSLKQREFDTREIGKALATGEYDGSFVRSFLYWLIDWYLFLKYSLVTSVLCGGVGSKY